MRLLVAFALLVLLAPATQAQVMASAPDAVPDAEPVTAFAPALEADLRGDAGAITVGQRLALVAGGVGGTALGFYLLGPAAPVGTAAGTWAAAELAGLDPTFGSVARATGLGVLAGVAAGAGTFGYFTLVEGQPNDFGTHIGSLIVGVAVSSVATGLLYQARPTVVRSASGAVVPGLALTVAL